MFESATWNARRLILRSLLNSVKENRGDGFVNGDQGHLAYLAGCEGEISFDDFGDSPDDNELYKMLKELSESFRNSDEFSQDDLVFSWEGFCRLATDAYKSQRG